MIAATRRSRLDWQELIRKRRDIMNTITVKTLAHKRAWCINTTTTHLRLGDVFNYVEVLVVAGWDGKITSMGCFTMDQLLVADQISFHNRSYYFQTAQHAENIISMEINQTDEVRHIDELPPFRQQSDPIRYKGHRGVS